MASIMHASGVHTFLPFEKPKESQNAILYGNAKNAAEHSLLSCAHSALSCLIFGVLAYYLVYVRALRIACEHCVWPAKCMSRVKSLRSRFLSFHSFSSESIHRFWYDLNFNNGKRLPLNFEFPNRFLSKCVPWFGSERECVYVNEWERMCVCVDVYTFACNVESMFFVFFSMELLERSCCEHMTRHTHRNRLIHNTT